MISKKLVLSYINEILIKRGVVVVYQQNEKLNNQLANLQKKFDIVVKELNKVKR